MMTIKEYITENKKRLESEFNKKYPNGQFIIQRWRNNSAISWNPFRRTSRTSPLGISNEQKDGQLVIDRFHQNNAFGKVYYADNIETAIKKQEN